MADVYIKFDELKTAKEDLDAIIEEFEKASSRADALEDAIGDPYGKDKLRENAEDFEDRWNHKRDQLKDGLKGVLDHMKAVIDGVQDWDSDTAAKLAPPKTTTTSTTSMMNGGPGGRTVI